MVHRMSTRPTSRLLLCLLGMMLLGPATAASAEALPSVSLSADHSTATVGETIHLIASTPEEVPSGYTIKIVEDNTSALLNSCGGNKCTAESGILWEENEHPTARYFHAEVSSEASEERTVSSEVAVTVEPYGFSVSLKISPSTVTIPEEYKLTAKANRDVEGTPYSIRIFNDDISEQVAACYSGTECSGTAATTWNENTLHTRHYHAEVSTGYGFKAGASSDVPVQVIPYYFDVSSAWGFWKTIEGVDWYEIIAATGRTLKDVPEYHLEIRKGDGLLGVIGEEIDRCDREKLKCVEYRYIGPYYADVENEAAKRLAATSRKT